MLVFYKSPEIMVNRQSLENGIFKKTFLYLKSFISICYK